MSKNPMARYLVTASAYVCGKTVAEGATQAQPQVIELDPSHDPSRRWLPCTRAAQEALARLGVHVDLVPEPGARPARRETSTMLEASQRRSKLASEFFNGPRNADVDPLTGEQRKPEPSRLVTPKE